MYYWLITIPIISAFTGWVTLRIAIWLLFHPREPKKFLGFRIHGIVPRRQQQFAENVSKMVSAEFIAYANIENRVSDPTNLQKIMPMIEIHVDDFLRVKLKAEMPMLSMFVGDKTISSLKKVFMQEIELLFPQVLKQFASNLQADLDLEKIIFNKVAGFSSDKLEGMVYRGMAKELRMVGIIGALIGFVLGCVQVLIILALSS